MLDSSVLDLNKVYSKIFCFRVHFVFLVYLVGLVTYFYQLHHIDCRNQ